MLDHCIITTINNKNEIIIIIITILITLANAIERCARSSKKKKLTKTRQRSLSGFVAIPL